MQHVPRERVQNLSGTQIVDVPVSKILVEIVELVGYRRQATARVDVHFPVPQIQEKIVEVIKVILREQCQRVRFFFLLTACGEELWATRKERVLLHCPLPHARFDSECKRWNLEHVVLDLFSRVRSNGFSFSRVCLLSWLRLLQFVRTVRIVCPTVCCR